MHHLIFPQVGNAFTTDLSQCSTYVEKSAGDLYELRIVLPKCTAYHNYNLLFSNHYQEVVKTALINFGEATHTVLKTGFPHRFTFLETGEVTYLPSVSTSTPPEYSK